MDFSAFIKGMDKDKLVKSIEAARNYLATEEGKKTAKMLSEGKMPDGQSIPDNLKEAATAISRDENAQKLLKGYMNKNG